MMRTPTLLLLSLAACVAGCRTTPPKTAARPGTTRPLADAYPTPTMAVTATPSGPGGGGGRAGLVHLDVYLVEVPLGTISGDAAFWRAVDENAVGGPAAGRTVQANGIRCGVAPRNQWPKLADLIAAQQGRSRRSQTQGVTTQSVDLDLDQPVDREDVFVYAADGSLSGRTFDHATNGVRVTFGPSPRTAGSIRLSFCPTVKRDQRRLEFTPLNQEYEVPGSDTVRVYDAGLTADVPPDGFFVIAPGPLAAANDTLLGSRFLVRPDPAARREQVVVAVPSYTRLDGGTVQVVRH